MFRKELYELIKQYIWLFAALKTKTHVTHQRYDLERPMTCKCVSAIILRNGADGFNISAELTDFSGRAIYIVDPKNITLIKEK